MLTPRRRRRLNMVTNDPAPQTKPTVRIRLSKNTAAHQDDPLSIYSRKDSLWSTNEDEPSDTMNYMLLLVLYTIQGIPMGLSASIPFLIQQKLKLLTAASVGALSDSAATSASNVAAMSYTANAVFALCSWPFSLKLLWAPVVDAVFIKKFGRRKTWIIPSQTLAGVLMVAGAEFVESQLGPTAQVPPSRSTINVQGVTAFFFLLYFLMATQDIAVDGWALSMLSKKNRGRGPVCNSVGQNFGYFLSFVGFLSLNDAESSETLWRPLLGLKSNPQEGLVSLGSFIRSVGWFMLLTTAAVAIFKRELPHGVPTSSSSVSVSSGNYSPVHANLKVAMAKKNEDDNEPYELDAAEIGLTETYHRLWAVAQLPSVRWLNLVLLTYRLPTALGDHVKFLKAVELGLSKSTIAMLSPTLILPIGILVPIVATRFWSDYPLRQFMLAYKVRVSIIPLLDCSFLLVLMKTKHLASTMSPTTGWSGLLWLTVIASTGLQSIVQSLQSNAQMTFFAHRVDPAIGGSYMTLLNTVANLGGTWPSSLVMWLVGYLTPYRCPPGSVCPELGTPAAAYSDPYFTLQVAFVLLGFMWIFLMEGKVRQISQLPDDAWRTHCLNSDSGEQLSDLDVEQGAVAIS